MSNEKSFQALIALAGAEECDEFATKLPSNMPENIKAVIARKREQEEALAAEHAAEFILEMFSAADQLKKKLIERIRAGRREIANAKAALDEMDRTAAYANETSNYLPMVKYLVASREFPSIEKIVRTINLDAYFVPTGWTPTNKPVEQKDEEAGAA